MAGTGAQGTTVGLQRPSGPRAEAREQAILDAALELVMEVGYDRLSMDALAERARAGKATIYRRWSGKAQVVAEAIRRRKSESEFHPDTGSLRGDLRAALRHMCDSVTLDEAVVAGVMSAMRSDPELAELMRTQVLHNRGSLDTIVDRAIARGELQAGSSAALAYEVAPAVVMQRLLFRGEPMDEAFTDHLVDEIVMPLLQRAPRSRPPRPTGRPGAPVDLTSRVQFDPSTPHAPTPPPEPPCPHSPHPPLTPPTTRSNRTRSAGSHWRSSRSLS